MQALADMGFVVVQMDGMGTLNRSKAFHDVAWKNIADAGFPDASSGTKRLRQNIPGTTSVGSASTAAPPAVRTRLLRCSSTPRFTRSESPTRVVTTTGWTRSVGMSRGWAGRLTRAIRHRPP